MNLCRFLYMFSVVSMVASGPFLLKGSQGTSLSTGGSFVEITDEGVAASSVAGLFADDGAASGSAASGSAVDIVKDGIVREDDGSIYYYRNGKIVTEALIHSGGSTFYFGVSGKAVKNTWRILQGNKYYFKKNARAAKGSIKIKKNYRIFDENGRLCTVSGKTKTVKVKGINYLVKKNGYASSGWHKMGNKMLHTRKNGAYDRRKKAGYIPLNGKGYAKSAEQVQAMLLARKFIKRHTNKKDSPTEKFRKCFKQIVGGNIYVGDWRPQGFGKKGWQYRSAIEMFSCGLVGDCYGISCAVAACAKDLGFQPYVIWAAHSHAFVIVDGKYYDNMHGAHFGTTTHEPYQVKEKFKF